MIHGLLWLPLLVFFFWITWAGRNEYKKVENYKEWATQFERAKYDIYAALGQAERTLTWGIPTRQTILDVQSIQLDDVQSIDLLIKGNPTFSQTVKGHAAKGDAVIQLIQNEGPTAHIPFTNIDLAKQWHQFLTKTLTAAR